MDVWLFNNSHLCQFIEIVHKIINWYMKNAKSLFVSDIIQVENKNVGLKVGGGGGGTNIPLPPQTKKWGGGAQAPLAPPLPTPMTYVAYRCDRVQIGGSWGRVGRSP